ncbi:hypothetical protein A1D23_00560 [Chelonobacter oris]|uniref:hypothetical protein n=1 Tax=Chelonobacter oris TaxID=505317 RepID=UPI00244690F2|nr:hypothetical protein [Chelonobacter oris]MDH3000055.1 hypothetical protein [Chelonobacter oris]
MLIPTLGKKCRQLIGALYFAISPISLCATEIGDICHVEAEAYYPGIWEPYGDDELICNYWKFLDIENPEFEENNIEAEYDNVPYDSL